MMILLMILCFPIGIVWWLIFLLTTMFDYCMEFVKYAKGTNLRKIKQICVTYREPIIIEAVNRETKNNEIFRTKEGLALALLLAGIGNTDTMNEACDMIKKHELVDGYQ